MDEKWRNVVDCKFTLLNKNIFWNSKPNNCILIHLAANVDTAEKMSNYLWDNNVNLTLKLVQMFSAEIGNKIIYASSASVYGAEEKDFSERINDLKPLNAYGFTKLQIDKELWDLTHIYGLRFFNLYGSGENFKGNMQSVINQAINKTFPLYNKEKNCWQLFRSYRPDIKDGEQMRDFIYVEDVCDIIYHFMINDIKGGIYNIGSGIARSFNELVNIVDNNIPIKYVDIPENIREHYQYYTCSNNTKLHKIAKYNKEFIKLEDGIYKTKKILFK